MPTGVQLFKYGRQRKWRRNRVGAFDGSPQKRGSIYKIATMTPRKPNSARRTFAKVSVLSNQIRVFAKIPGIGEHYLQVHHEVLLRGQGPKDSPGINYHAIRGVGDFDKPESFGRKNRRSKFGVKRESID